MPTYNSPVNFNFTAGGYSATLPLEFVFSAFGETKTRAVEGFDTLEFGLGLIFNTAESYQFDGFDALEFGLQAIAIREPDIFGIGIGPSQWGFANVAEVVDIELPVPGIAGALGEPVITRTVVFTFGRTGYAPEYPLPFDFSVSETLQATYTLGIDFATFGGHVVGLASDSILAVGIDELEVPQPTVAGAFLQAELTGIYELAFGAHVVLSGQLFVSVPGFAPGTYGTAAVTNGIPELFPTGIGGLAFGVHAILNFRSEAFPVWTMEDAYGTALVAFEVRVVSAQGFSDEASGAAFVSNYTQTAEVPGLPSQVIGDHAVSFEIELAPFGFDASAFGGHEVRDNTLYAYPPPILGERGLPEIRRAQEIVRADGIAPVDDFGDVEAFNRLQIVAVLWDFEHVAGPVSAPLVENFTKQAFPLGFESLRAPDFADVVNGRPPVIASLGVQTEFGFLFVAPSVRSVSPAGFDAYNTGSGFVLNAAQSFTPDGFDAQQFGVPNPVFNGLQFSAEITAGLTQQIGTAFVAPRVRSIFPGGIFQPGPGQHYAGNYTQFFAPPGIPSFIEGLPFVEERRLIVEHRNQEDYLAVGAARIENRNVVLRPLPWDDASFGLADAKLYTRYLNPPGFFAEVSGVHIIGDRQIFIRPIAISGVIGSHWVRPFPIPPERIDVSVNGIDATNWGMHLVVGNSIFPVGWDELQMGDASAAGSGIYPRGIYEDFTADTRPSVDATQYIWLGPTDTADWPSNGIKPPLWDIPDVPRVSPHTIWAPTGAPGQAKDNHPPGEEEPIHILGDRQKRNTLYGTPFVAHRVRTLRPSWNWVQSQPSDDPATRWGEHVIGQSFTQYIEPRWRVGRFGIHEAFGGDRTAQVPGFDDLLMGEHAIERLPEPAITKTVFAIGFSGSFGTTWVSNYLQQVTANGFDATVWGTQWVNRPYPPFAIPSLADDAYGEPWISNYRREVYIFGADTLLMQEELPFARMRVTGRGGPLLMGFDASSYGSALIEQSSRALQAFSLFRLPFPSPTVLGQTVAQAEGHAALTLGLPIIDQVEPNSLKAKGEDTAEIGGAILRAAIAAGHAAGVMGEPRIGMPIYAASMAGVVEIPVITGDDDHTCGMAARAVVGSAGAMGAFGVATIG